MFVVFQVPPPIFLTIVGRGTVLKPDAVIVAEVVPPLPVPSVAMKTTAPALDSKGFHKVPSK